MSAVPASLIASGSIVAGYQEAYASNYSATGITTPSIHFSNGGSGDTYSYYTLLYDQTNQGLMIGDSLLLYDGISSFYAGTASLSYLNVGPSSSTDTPGAIYASYASAFFGDTTVDSLNASKITVGDYITLTDYNDSSAYVNIVSVFHKATSSTGLMPDPDGATLPTTGAVKNYVEAEKNSLAAIYPQLDGSNLSTIKSDLWLQALQAVGLSTFGDLSDLNEYSALVFPDSSAIINLVGYVDHIYKDYVTSDILSGYAKLQCNLSDYSEFSASYINSWQETLDIYPKAQLEPVLNNLETSKADLSGTNLSGSSFNDSVWRAALDVYSKDDVDRGFTKTDASNIVNVESWRNKLGVLSKTETSNLIKQMQCVVINTDTNRLMTYNTESGKWVELTIKGTNQDEYYPVYADMVPQPVS